jgi:hypothetical protein
MLKSMRKVHLPRGARPGSKTDDLEAKAKTLAQTPNTPRRSLGAKFAPQCQKGVMGDKFSQLNRKSPYRPCNSTQAHRREERGDLSPVMQRHGLPRRRAPLHEPAVLSSSWNCSDL